MPRVTIRAAPRAATSNQTLKLPPTAILACFVAWRFANICATLCLVGGWRWFVARTNIFCLSTRCRSQCFSNDYYCFCINCSPWVYKYCLTSFCIAERKRERKRGREGERERERDMRWRKVAGM